MNLSIPFFWWRLEFIISSELEESILWKLKILNINEVSIESIPSKTSQKKLFIWLSSHKWSGSDREELIKSLLPLAKAFDKELSYPKIERIKNSDWEREWKKYWKPDPIGDNLLILPAWLGAPKEYEKRQIIRLDPGCAFGTGGHPTTRLCLSYLDLNPPIKLNVADLGCGSGVLGIAALSLGANKVLAVDIDNLAVHSARGNARLNNLNLEEIVVFHGSIDKLESELDGECIDLLFCNIIYSVIAKIAPYFGRIVDKNGRLILSGLLISQLEDVSKLFNSLGWNTVNSCELEGWVLLEVRRR